MTRRTLGRAILGAILVSGLGCHARIPATPRELAVEDVEVMPDFTTNALVYARDAGNSIRMGSEVLWTFGDTFTWTTMQCATAAWAPVTAPGQLYEPVDSYFSSFQFYPFTPEELAYNESRDPPACCKLNRDCGPSNSYCWCPRDADCTTRIALWPGDLLATDETHAYQLYEKVRIGSAPYDFEHMGTGLVVTRKGETTAHRVLGPDGQPLLLFGPDEPNFLRAVEVAEGPRIHVYLYAVTNRHECAVDIMLARVELGSMLDRSAYEFWNGDGWSDSLDLAAPILRQIPGGLGSVAWNDHLNQYLAAFNDFCAGSTSLVLRTAPRPEGPWSEPVNADLTAFGPGEGAYAGQIHASLGTDRELVFTYYQQTSHGIGKLRMGRLRLR